MTDDVDKQWTSQDRPRLENSGKLARCTTGWPHWLRTMSNCARIMNGCVPAWRPRVDGNSNTCGKGRISNKAYGFWRTKCEQDLRVCKGLLLHIFKSDRLVCLKCIGVLLSPLNVQQ
jgi:hypothetical protein